MKLDYLELGFETCEIARIPGKYIAEFYVGDLETTYERLGCNAIHKLESCHRFAVEIHRDANCRHGNGTVFERIQAYPDVTSIKFSIDGEEHQFWIDYDEESLVPPQKSYLSKPGHLYLVIGENAEMSDFFDKENIDDPEYVDFWFEMYDVGDVNQSDKTKED